MFLNTLGTHGNITPDVKSFFDYVNNHIITSDFTQQIDAEVAEIKHNKKARDEYMLWEAMKTDLKREGKAEGRVEGKFESIRNLMHSLHCSVDQAMDLLQTLQQERQHYKDLLAKNA